MQTVISERGGGENWPPVLVEVVDDQRCLEGVGNDQKKGGRVVELRTRIQHVDTNVLFRINTE